MQLLSWYLHLRLSLCLTVGGLRSGGSLRCRRSKSGSLALAAQALAFA